MNSINRRSVLLAELGAAGMGRITSTRTTRASGWCTATTRTMARLPMLTVGPASSLPPLSSLTFSTTAAGLNGPVIVSGAAVPGVTKTSWSSTASCSLLPLEIPLEAVDTRRQTIEDQLPVGVGLATAGLLAHGVEQSERRPAKMPPAGCFFKVATPPVSAALPGVGAVDVEGPALGRGSRARWVHFSKPSGIPSSR